MGKRIDINTWKEQYKADKEVCERIEDFLTRHTYAMPVLSFQMTKEIELEILRKFNPNFVCPQMYYYLDNYPELFDFIRKNGGGTAIFAYQYRTDINDGTQLLNMLYV